MITFKQFITEEDKTVDEVVALLKKECAPYLNHIEGHPPSVWLKRGWVAPPPGPYFHMSTRKNRKPVDMSQQMHMLLDYTLLHQQGGKFRSEGIFSCVSPITAGSYGDEVYIVLPRGEFRYCWSPEVEDAYAFFDYHKHDSTPMGLRQMEAALGKEFDPETTDINVGSPEWLKFVAEYLEKREPYISGDLDVVMNRAGLHRHEVMITCESAYYVMYNHDPSSMQNLRDTQFAAEVLEALA